MTVHCPPPQVSKIACRQIRTDDEAGVALLLSKGFEVRSAAYWTRALETLRNRTVPEGCPRYGYCLTADGEIVGVILLIFSQAPDTRSGLRCNVSSWYVLPRFRVYASSLVNTGLRNKTATYVNCSSIASTRQTIVAQGFSCYVHGQYLAFAAAGAAVQGLRIRRVSAQDSGGDELESDLLSNHAAYGCISLLLTLGRDTHPFVFLKRTVPRFKLPCAQLIYCRDIGSFVRFHGPLGRYLLAGGMPVVMLDANGPIEGLTGHYFEGRGPKYALGDPPRLGDLAYTESVLFGP